MEITQTFFTMLLASKSLRSCCSSARPQLFRSTQQTAAFSASALARNYEGPTDGYDHTKDYTFQPVAMQSFVSPMRRTTTWLEALRAKEKKQLEWLTQHKEEIQSGKLNPNQQPPIESFSYKDVVTENVQSKSPRDSFSYVVLPFKSDEWFLDAYINAYGRLRIGQIFQDLDALAGVIAYRHCSPAQPVIVTASVDRIFMKKRLDTIAGYNVSLSGNVTWTGRSSMEITIKACTHTDIDIGKDSTLQPEDINDDNVFMTASFTFVARHPTTKKSFPVNHVVPKTMEELKEFVRAEKYNQRKREAASKTSLTHQPPSEEESSLIHSKWLQQLPQENGEAATVPSSSSGPIVSILMKDTRIHSTAMMQPQYRNRHSYMIFGGYLLRQTFELAYSCSAAFAHSAPRFVSLDETTFRNPVPVGSVLYMTATVVYTEFINRKQNPEAGEHEKQLAQSNDNSDGRQSELTSVPGTLIQVRVDSLVRDISHGTTTNTGSFVYSFFAAAQTPLSNLIQREAASSSSSSSPEEKIENILPPGPQKFFTVIPQTYSEMMEYLEGRRRAIETANFNAYERLIPTGSVVSE